MKLSVAVCNPIVALSLLVTKFGFASLRMILKRQLSNCCNNYFITKNDRTKQNAANRYGDDLVSMSVLCTASYVVM